MARPFVAVLISLMIASALFVWEPWPFTSFRLFSHLRYDEQTAWGAKAVGPDGAEVPYPIGSYDRGLRGFGFVMAEFVVADESRQDEICEAWVEQAPARLGLETDEVLLYTRGWRLSERSDERALPGTEELRYVCTLDGTRDAG